MVVMSVYDEKSKGYVVGLQLYKNVDVAIRDFSQVCSDKNSNFNKFPEDYSLCYFGSWDENDGKFQLLDSPTKIISAKEVLSNG